jgi:hypothetical protein
MGLVDGFTVLSYDVCSKDENQQMARVFLTDVVGTDLSADSKHTAGGRVNAENGVFLCDNGKDIHSTGQPRHFQKEFVKASAVIFV